MLENLGGSRGVSLPDSVQKIDLGEPYLEAFSAVSRIQAAMPRSRMADLFSWFPTPERQAALVKASADQKARQVTSLLGNTVAAYDQVQYLHIYRPQDRTDSGTAATDLDLTRDEAGVVQPIAMAAIHKIEAYTQYVIDRLLQGNLALVASKITTAGQATGFHIRFMDEINSGERMDMEKMRITFTDESPAINDSLDAVLYLDDLPRDAQVDKAHYDPEEDIFEIQFATASQ